ncbi:MAG: hypothetical protein JNM93_01555 [Bacteriovoracaceae bacterium]|nr:hypothetical protein [Bacteriovoracaceae bacterium]
MLFYELQDLGWRASEKEFRVQVTQNFLRQESNTISMTNSHNESQLQTQKLLLNYGITDRFDLYFETGYQSKLITRSNGMASDQGVGATPLAIGVSYRVIEEYPAYANFDIALSFSPKSDHIEIGSRRNVANGGNVAELLLLVNKKVTIKHELQFSYKFIHNSEKEIRIYTTPITFDPATNTVQNHHSLQFIHNYKFRPASSLLSSFVIDQIGEKKLKVPGIPMENTTQSSMELSLATGIRWNIAENHLFSFLIGAKWNGTQRTTSNINPDEKTQDQKAEFIQLQYTFAHQFL